MKKVILTIALICLSLGAIAQTTTLYTNVYFAKLPVRPLDRPQDVKVVVTWYLSTGGYLTNFTHSGTVNVGDLVSVAFTGSPEDGSKVTHTKIDLYFYNNYCGTGKTFEKFLALATFSNDFTGSMWWQIKGPNDMERGIGSGGYIITQTPTP